MRVNIHGFVECTARLGFCALVGLSNKEALMPAIYMCFKCTVLLTSATAAAAAPPPPPINPPKAILNKLTPDNFERLSQQLLDVGITEAKTLIGLIAQVFDKALFEPHFCELYSQLCFVLQKRLPEFEDPGGPAAGAGGGGGGEGEQQCGVLGSCV